MGSQPMGTDRKNTELRYGRFQLQMGGGRDVLSNRVAEPSRSERRARRRFQRLLLGGPRLCLLRSRQHGRTHLHRTSGCERIGKRAEQLPVASRASKIRSALYGAVLIEQA